METIAVFNENVHCLGFANGSPNGTADFITSRKEIVPVAITMEAFCRALP